MDETQRIPSMTKVHEEMLDALRTSVLEIVAANPSDAKARLEKSFDGFAKALGKRLAEDLPVAVGEADPVSLLGDRINRVQEAIEAIEAGAVPGADMVNPESVTLAKGVVEFGGLVLHAMAADFAEEADETTKLAEGEGLYKVATDGGEVLVKSALPEHAAVLTADPAETAGRMAEFFLEGLEWLGVDLRQLAKKAPPPFKRKPAAAEDEGEGAEDEGDEAEDGEFGEGEGAEDEGDEAEDGEFGEGEGAEDEGDEAEDGAMGGSPLENISRLTALALLEIDALKQQAGGDGMEDPDGGLSALDAIGQHLALACVSADALNGAVSGAEDPAAMDPAAMDPNAQAAGENAMGADQGDMPSGEGDAAAEPADEKEFEKGVPAGELAKARQIAGEILKKAESAEQRAADAEARAAAAEKRIEALTKAEGAKPAPPKGSTGVAAALLTKQADTGGEQGETPAEREQRLAKLAVTDPNAAAFELMKAAQRQPFVATR
jgi:hypothetical protein